MSKNSEMGRRLANRVPRDWLRTWSKRPARLWELSVCARSTRTPRVYVLETVRDRVERNVDARHGGGGGGGGGVGRTGCESRSLETANQSPASIATASAVASASMPLRLYAAASGRPQKGSRVLVVKWMRPWWLRWLRACAVGIAYISAGGKLAMAMASERLLKRNLRVEGEFLGFRQEWWL